MPTTYLPNSIKLKKEYVQAIFQSAWSATSPAEELVLGKSIKGKEDEGPICELHLIGSYKLCMNFIAYINAQIFAQLMRSHKYVFDIYMFL